MLCSFHILCAFHQANVKFANNKKISSFLIMPLLLHGGVGEGGAAGGGGGNVNALSSRAKGRTEKMLLWALK